MQAKMLRIVDRYFGMFLYVWSWMLLPFLTNRAENKNVLVIKLWAIGESVLVLPSIKALKNKGYNITVICTKQNKAVFESQMFIDRVVIFDFKNPFKAVAAILSLRKYRFSVSIDSDPYMKFSAVLGAISGASVRHGLDNRRHLYTRSVKIDENEHAVLSFYRIFASFQLFPVPRALVPIYVKPLNMALPSKSLAIHAGSASTSRTRRWSEENFAAVCDFFASKGWAVYLVGAANEKGLNKRIISCCKHRNRIQNLSGQLSLHELAYLFSKMKLVIANDAGPMHIAAAMGTPTLGLFGPNVPERFGPYGKNCMGLRKDNKPPCILPFRAQFPECDHEHMKNLSAQDVIEAAKTILAKIR
ncbi:MAG: glycosyltransferase family 9 protein [Candidatus Aenigmarchaeota archaeon]|nr:glycosyltransferase family 9 protein [Candidatus Aenigmarchaeota archaeon]